MTSVNKENFDSLIESSKEKPLILDFYADWCGPCKLTLPRFEQASIEIGDKAVFAKVNVEESENKDIAVGFKVSSIPCFIIIKDGVEVERFLGSQTKEFFLEKMSFHAQ